MRVQGNSSLTPSWPACRVRQTNKSTAARHVGWLGVGLQLRTSFNSRNQQQSRASIVSGSLGYVGFICVNRALHHESACCMHPSSAVATEESQLRIRILKSLYTSLLSTFLGTRALGSICGSGLALKLKARDTECMCELYLLCRVPVCWQPFLC